MDGTGVILHLRETEGNHSILDINKLQQDTGASSISEVTILEEELKALNESSDVSDNPETLKFFDLSKKFLDKSRQAYIEKKFTIALQSIFIANRLMNLASQINSSSERTSLIDDENLKIRIEEFGERLVSTFDEIRLSQDKNAENLYEQAKELFEKSKNAFQENRLILSKELLELASTLHQRCMRLVRR